MQKVESKQASNNIVLEAGRRQVFFNESYFMYLGVKSGHINNKSHLNCMAQTPSICFLISSFGSLLKLWSAYSHF